MESLPLAGQSALVTGGAIRLGRAIALALAARGADIALHFGRSRAEAEHTVAEIRALGRRCVAVSGDLADPAVPAALVQDASEALGPLRILINSAAVFPKANLADTPLALWESTLAINLRAPFLLSQAFAAQTSTGCILNLADWRAERPDGAYLAYSIAKAGLLAMTFALAKSLAPGIRVNAIEPGAILPPPGKSEADLAALRDSIPLGRTGTTEDIARAAVYLVEAPFVTGETLRVTGGQHL